ncbi:transporter substrate-binding domain-containing protein [Sansalvadorimonas sp. 2012CJ34-2]|uniref:Transporter substrate-binding domain-containing protein n=1 Tax=Parendozoicomonas callyspongiae TaxID=2942213 RepID=A0ABT0PI50_9GAMM|nr:transporter substrate-binding domain-containing protein [Sansalvadorimonas sp. 2012CJ34-2]MCL6271055.1 transporter substrate-binding domain-containing protein [Sansalvadorimonas sp. 2012CJ34-2]
MLKIKQSLIVIMLFQLLTLSGVALCADEKGDWPDILNVGLIEGGREPYYWLDSEKQIPEGFYIDVMRGITEDTGIRFNYYFVPQARIRLYMRLGLFNLEPGIAESWRQETEEVNHSVYSEPFLILHEAIVSHAPLNPDASSLQDLPPGRVCQVLGFSGKDNRGHEEIIVITDLQSLKMIGRGRCDYAVMPLDVASYLSSQLKIKVYFSQPLKRHLLSLRLDRQFEYLLPDINRSLVKMWESGYMEELIKRYGIQSMETNELNSLAMAGLPASY